MQCARIRLRDAGICPLNESLFKIDLREEPKAPQTRGRQGKARTHLRGESPALLPMPDWHQRPFPTPQGSNSLQDTLQAHCTTCRCPAGLFNSRPPLKPCPLRAPALTAPLPSPWQPSCQETCLIHLLLMHELNQLLEGCFTSQSNNNIPPLQLGKLRHTKRCPRVHWN